MQSSIMVTIRALLLLAAAVVIPAIAILGTPALQRLRGALPPAVTRATSEGLAAPQDRSGRVETVRRPMSGGRATQVGTPRETQPPQRPSPPATQTPWRSEPPISPDQAALWTPPQPASAGPGSPERSDPIQRLKQRLKQLGAVYFRLEAFGTSGYRFHCELPLPGNSRYNQHFEATDEDPVTAMRQVVAEVERWRHDAVARRAGPAAR